MALLHEAPLEWHEGEKAMHSLLHIPDQDNPTVPGLAPYGASITLRSPLLALGTLDDDGRPWTTLLGGEPAFTRPIGPSIIGVKTLVDRRYDPVLGILVGGKQDGEVNEQGRQGWMVSGLPIDLTTRNRVKLSGNMVAGAIEQIGPVSDEDEGGVGEVQLIIQVERSLGNCPKYLNKKQIIPAMPDPVLISESLPLPDQALKLIAKADVFFISSSHNSSMGTNHRGGPVGFVRVLTNDASGTSLVFPEYSGNRLYQTLGNLQTNPRAGIVFADFDTQDVLYMTGTTETIIGSAAAALLPRSNLVVKVHLIAARFVQRGLAFRGVAGEYSPYNPSIRYLPSEHATLFSQTVNTRTKIRANLIAKTVITPTIARFRFKIDDAAAAGSWSAGQYVALSFEDELGLGYSHMRDSDPRSLNDDFIRTFTISSPSPSKDSPNDEFEITIRNVGVATNFLFRRNVRAGLELPLNGFGGSFALPIPSSASDSSSGEISSSFFVAGGIGITPLLAQAPDLQSLSSSKFHLFWMINSRDLNLVVDTFTLYPWLARFAQIFISSPSSSSLSSSKEQTPLLNFDAKVFQRRLAADDILAAAASAGNEGSTWYLCTGTSVRKSLLEWLVGKKVVYEDFNY